MTCQDEIAELLPWYVAGTLSAAERKKVEAHLKVCSICEKSLKEVRWISESMEKYKSILPEEHIDPENLVIYAESKEELAHSQVAEIERHLEACTDCKTELDTLLKVEADLKESGSFFFTLREALGRLLSKPIVHLPPTTGRPIGGGFGRVVLKPAFAYILVLLLLYPAWLGLREIFLKPEAPNVRTFRLEEKLTFRGPAHREEEIVVLPSDEVIHVVFSIPVADLILQYDLDLFFEENLVLAQKDIKAVDNQGNFSVFLAAKSLKDGQYKVKVTERHPGDPQHLQEYLFSFQLKQK